MADEEIIKLKETYSSLDGKRSAIISRAEDYAKLTIPSVFLSNTSSANDKLPLEMVSGFGAKLVNHLTGKFAISILPPSQPFFRLLPIQEVAEEIAQGDEEKLYELEQFVANKEDKVLKSINNSGFRKSLYPALRTAMITGDALIEKIDDKRSSKYRVFNMNHYVIERDGAGNITKMIIKETVVKDTLPEDIRNEVKESSDDKDIELYTGCILQDDGNYRLVQELDGKLVGEDSIMKPEEFESRFISLRWNKVDGEDYGRGYVEEHSQTFISLNKFLKIVFQSGAISAKTLFLVNPNGFTKVRDLNKASNGQYVVGSENDVGVLRTDKSSELTTVYNSIQDFKRELSEGFLLGSSAVRNAERVTAQEIQMIAGELEASFGGVYTTIADDIQMPLIQNALKDIGKDNKSDNIYKDVEIVITAGLESLGRSIELNKLNGFMEELSMVEKMFGGEVISEKVDVGNLIKAIVLNSGIANRNLIKSSSQAEADKQATQQQEVQNQANMSMANEAGKQQAVQQTNN